MTIQDPKKQQEYYEALLQKDPQYLGLFFVGVTTTGIFCISTCRARKPKKEHTVFYTHIRDALRDGFRPCKICNPTVLSFETPDQVVRVLEMVKEHPKVNIRDYQLRQEGITPEVVRRWFKKNYGMTFHGYQRMIRINQAMEELTKGTSITESAMASGYESLSGFSYTYKQITGTSPSNKTIAKPLLVKRISTPLGPMLIGVSADGLVLLEFVDRRMLETELKELSSYFDCSIFAGENRHTHQTERELEEYFAGTRTQFTLSLDTPGTEFQKTVWQALVAIPYGTTQSYEDIAQGIGSPGSVRAVGTANGRNRVAIVVPCHRVIRKDGSLGGYGGGLERKQWLLDFEQRR
jgi:AraC family transcriptional regulator of adaptative response/methylated-DNA-[protein]-cysteine methyltransferase